jgi:hypothetical protein
VVSADLDATGAPSESPSDLGGPLVVSESDLAAAGIVVLASATGAPVPRGHVQYSIELANDILEKYVDGQSLFAISQIPGMPSYPTILRWARDSKKMADAFERARVTRAINLEERALALADLHIDKDDAPGERLRFDILRWGAETHDAQRFGKKVTHAGDPDRPIILQVQTGVPEPSVHQQVIELDSSGLAASSVASGASDVPGDPPPILEESTEIRSELVDRLEKEAAGVNNPSGQ